MLQNLGEKKAIRLKVAVETLGGVYSMTALRKYETVPPIYSEVQQKLSNCQPQSMGLRHSLSHECSNVGCGPLCSPIEK